MNNKLFNILIIFSLIFGNIYGFSQETDSREISKESAETFYDGSFGNILSTVSIIATNTIHPGAQVNYYSEKSIKFTTGFKAFLGSSVKTKIEASNKMESGSEEMNIDSFSDIIAIYPNPSKGLVNIKIKETDFPVQLNIYNYTGKVILYKEIMQYVEQINLTSYPKGIYIIKLQINGKFNTRLFTLE